MLEPKQLPGDGDRLRVSSTMALQAAKHAGLALPLRSYDNPYLRDSGAANTFP